MNNLLNDRNELLEAVKAPERKKKQPGNEALYAAFIFANLVFCLLDVISSFTVYKMTESLLYGILTFLAGFGPLLLHEMLFTRAFASETQKKIAVTGAVTALFSIVLIGILAGYVNIAGIGLEQQSAEIVTIIVLVLIAAFHALLAIAYFYIDPGIVSQQITAQTIARAIQQGKMIEAGDYILNLTQKSVAKRHEIGNKHNMAALVEVLRQMGFEDLNGDGIPDVLQGGGVQQPRQMPMNQFNATAPRIPDVARRENGNEPPNS